jgi:5-aminopentanamidase
MKLALWQGTSPASDLETALAQAEAALKAAAAMGAAALVLPEIWLPGYNQDDIPDRAMPLDSPALQRLARAARSAACAVVAGYAERCGDLVHNSAVCFGPDGQLLANYRKIQLYGPRERALYTAGDAYVTFRLAGVTAAILICYDVEFSHHISALAERGVQVILTPTANMAPFTHVIRHTVPAMAANHGVAIAYANYCGSEGNLSYVGGSLIAGPHGEVLAQAGEHPALLVAEIPEKDPARLSTQNADIRILR